MKDSKKLDLNNIEAFIFDLDGLLIDSEPFWRDVEHRVFNDLGIPFKREWCKETVGMRIDEVVAYWSRRFPDNIPENLIQQVSEKIILNMEGEILKNGKAKAGVYNVLELAKKLNKKTAIASSSYTILINAAVKKLDIKGYIHQIVSAQEMEYGKPHPQIFISTAELLNTVPEKCLVFEDSWHGLVAALAARMKVVAVPEKENRNDPKFNIADLKISSLNEFSSGE